MTVQIITEPLSVRIGTGHFKTDSVLLCFATVHKQKSEFEQYFFGVLESENNMLSKIIS